MRLMFRNCETFNREACPGRDACVGRACYACMGAKVAEVFELQWVIMFPPATPEPPPTLQHVASPSVPAPPRSPPVALVNAFVADGFEAGQRVVALVGRSVVVYGWIRRFLGAEHLEFSDHKKLVFSVRTSNDPFARWLDLVPPYKSEWREHSVVRHWRSCEEGVASVHKAEDSQEVVEHMLGSQKLASIEQLYQDWSQ